MTFNLWAWLARVR